MSFANRHPLRGEPIAPEIAERLIAGPQTGAETTAPRPSLVAAVLAPARALLGSRSADAKRVQPADRRRRRSVFQRLAAADLAYRDVARPLFKDSFRR